jgi:hypothetical protein
LRSVFLKSGEFSAPRPSEFVVANAVANALRNALPEFLIASSESDSLAKFIADRQNNENMRIFRLAS